VRPSGRFPSAREHPDGSLIEGTPPDLRARKMTSLAAACRDHRPFDLLQASPWRPNLSTFVPHGQRWDTQVTAPRRSAQTTRKDSSERWVPSCGAGRAWSQAPAWTSVEARRRAWSVGVVAVTFNVKRVKSWRGASHSSWAPRNFPICHC